MSQKKRRTRYKKSRGCLFLLLAAVGIFCAVSFWPRAAYTNADFGIADYVSQRDQDGDGVDDQTDLLEGAKAYVATNPHYRSAYYEGGYPDDGYGVCTDVVAQGMLAAGYDLRQLVDADIRAHPEDYGLETPDPNIDFRRVRNLAVYFAHTAVALTTDPAEIAEWQGGDIVIFARHIGVVSDRRNADGVPYLIHHSHPMQMEYEQDVLGDRSDIIGHYRVS